MDIDGVEVLPKPLQQPHPPVWLASSSPDAIAWSAVHGYSILMDPHSTHADLGTKYRAYLDGLAAHGHPTDGRVTPMARLLAIAATDDEAREIARRGAEWTITSYINPGKTSFTKDLRPAGAPHDNPADPVERYVEHVIIHGSPARV